MEVKSLGRVKMIRPKTDSLPPPPPPPPFAPKQSCIFCSLSTLLCLETEVFAYPNTVRRGKGTVIRGIQTIAKEDIMLHLRI